MGRLKRTSPILDKAQKRAVGLGSINSSLDLGNGLTLKLYSETIQNVQQKQDTYNQAIATLDALYNDLLTDEKNLADLSERMLTGVAAKYGKNSNEYEQAGGVRKSERKTRTLKVPTTG
ncbi:hypothetical protein [Anthocerotibacter panamensis]|uniref:hypothetical protein n=1 Tax=Anthocerotibacter panamensis TaxID=2857077 RepID=UPI001C4053E2|nr:hypothetical protein [Anthocerotibacter panamensis]